MYHRMKRANRNVVSTLVMIIRSKQLGKIQLKSADIKKMKRLTQRRYFCREEQLNFIWYRHVGKWQK